MPVDFPNSPSVNDVFDSGVIKYIWNGAVWNLYSSENEVVSVSTNYSALKTDSFIYASSSSAPVTVTLPSAADISGKQISIKKSDATANVVAITTTSSQKIDGWSNVVLKYQYECLTVVSDGSNWLVV